MENLFEWNGLRLSVGTASTRGGRVGLGESGGGANVRDGVAGVGTALPYRAAARISASRSWYSRRSSVAVEPCSSSPS